MARESRYLIPILYAIKFPSSIPVGFSVINQHDHRALSMAEALCKISALQKDMAEIFCDKEIAISQRMKGIVDGYKIIFFEKFCELRKKPYAFKVVFTDDMPSESEIDEKVIVVSTRVWAGGSNEYLQLNSITPEILKERLIRISSRLYIEDRATLAELRDNVGFEESFKRIRTDITVSSGFYSRPYILLLGSLRIEFLRGKFSLEFLQDEMQLQLDLIAHVRTHIATKLDTGDMTPAVRHYFTDLSCSLDFACNRSETSELSFRNQGVENPSDLVAAIKYAERGDLRTDISDNPYIAEVERERILLDGLIALAAANNVAPVIKLPLSVNRIFTDVNIVALADRGDGKKINAMMRRLRDSFAPYLNIWLENLDSSPSAAIKFVSNLPLEWAYHQSLPLMVRHEVSRIPVTPGYVATRLLIDSSNVHLSLDDFREILFISSFADDDPIGEDLRRKLEIIQKITRIPEENIEKWKNLGVLPENYELSNETNRLEIRIKWIEVANRAELIEAINRNPCAITIFDLHGSHSKGGGGIIHLKDEALSIFDISSEIRISPIVVLSSCDTSPIDKGHNTTADGFFLAGAKTVISSALPIQSDLASTFVVRLFERIRTYLPIRVKNEGRPIRWSTFVSGMIRRTYYLELINLLQEQLHFSAEKKSELLMRIGMKLDPLSPDWVMSATLDIVSALGIGEKYLENFVSQKVQFLECMKYFQLGRPENVIISAARAYDRPYHVID